MHNPPAENDISLSPVKLVSGKDGSSSSPISGIYQQCKIPTTKQFSIDPAVMYSTLMLMYANGQKYGCISDRPAAIKAEIMGHSMVEWVILDSDENDRLLCHYMVSHENDAVLKVQDKNWI